MKRAVLLAALLLTSTIVFADDRYVEFDRSMDFSTLKSFAIRPGRIDSGRPELNNSLVLKKITDAVRMALQSKGMMEVAEKPDVVVVFIASGVDYNVGPGGIAYAIDASRGDRGGRGAPSPGERGPVDFSKGTLVLDVSTVQPSRLVWRGVYHDHEANSSKLGQKFPEDAKKLLSEYPRKK